MKLTFTLLTLCFALSAQVLPVIDATPGTQLCILNDSDAARVPLLAEERKTNDAK